MTSRFISPISSFARSKTSDIRKTIGLQQNEHSAAEKADCVSGRGKYDINITLGTDIDLTGMDWMPICTEDHPYISTFNGGNHTITGLAISGSFAPADLFGVIDTDSTILNVALANVSISGNSYVDAIVGENSGTVDTCYWSDYIGNGICSGSDTSATKVDAGSTTWANAKGFMTITILNLWKWVYADTTNNLLTLKWYE